ncbi:TPA: hypothetical protein ACH3X3_003475 [Trebouxia sp. C0006]
MLESSGVRGMLACSAQCIRRTSQVPHRVRRLTSYLQEAHKKAHNLYARHTCGMAASPDSMPQRQSQQLDKGPNTSLLADELQQQWHDRLNMHLGNILIRPGSNRKVWWSCDQCPEGFPHIMGGYCCA